MGLNYSLAATIADDRIILVNVKFNNNGCYNSKEYTYKTFFADLKVDDLVIVLSPSGYQVVKVTALNVFVELDSSIQYKWIINKFDDSQYQAVLQKEYDLKDELKQLELQNKRRQFMEAMNIKSIDTKMLE